MGDTRVSVGDFINFDYLFTNIYFSSVIALSKLYSLNDARLAQTSVRGDLIINETDQIMTRSKAKLSKSSSFLSLPPPPTCPSLQATN